MSQYLCVLSQESENSHWPNAAIACFRTVCKLRMVFTSLNVCKEIKRKITYHDVKIKGNSSFDVHRQGHLGMQPHSIFFVPSRALLYTENVGSHCVKWAILGVLSLLLLCVPAHGNDPFRTFQTLKLLCNLFLFEFEFISGQQVEAFAPKVLF